MLTRLQVSGRHPGMRRGLAECPRSRIGPLKDTGEGATPTPPKPGGLGKHLSGGLPC